MGSTVGAHGRIRRWIASILLVLVAAACSVDADPITADAAASPAELPLADSVAPTTTVARSSTTTAAPTTTTIPPDPYRTWIATAKAHVAGLEAYTTPDGDRFALPFFVPNPHQFGGPLTLMVVEGRPGDAWMKVQLPIRPNGQTAWIRSSDYVIDQTRVWAEVVLSETAVRVFDGDELIAETAAVIGADATPTPLGTFYVAAKKENGAEEYFLGPNALVLSGFSEALETFSGGLPVIAIHGTHRPEQVGSRLSNGCIRVPNEVIEFLGQHVPIGAPVHISA